MYTLSGKKTEGEYTNILTMVSLNGGIIGDFIFSFSRFLYFLKVL